MVANKRAGSPGQGLTVLFVSGAVGFFVLAFGFPNWQVAVETAQALAGIVQYPPDNPFYIYHLRVWTVIHHVCALLLRAGVSELDLSMLLSGLQGMLTFQALAMCVYAFSRDAVHSLTSALIVLASGTAIQGVTYPIFLLGAAHTYGAVGLSLVVLAAALIACGHCRISLFLVGLSPAVHPSLGLWLVVIVSACLAMDPARARRMLGDGWRALAAGSAITMASLAVQAYMARAIGVIPSNASPGDLASFTALWDEHRRPVSFGETGVWICAGTLVLAAIWLIGETRRKRMVEESADGPLPPDSIFLLRFVAIAGVLAMGSVVLSSVPPEHVPAGILILMPTRLLNVNVLMLTAIVLGLTGASSRWWCGPWKGVVFASLLMVGSRSLLWGFASARGWTVTPPAIDSLVILASFAALVGLAGVVTPPRSPARAAREGPRRARLIVNLARISLVAVIVWIAAGPIRMERERREFRNQSDALVFSRAARGTGFLLTGGDLELIQLRTRRPLLINSGALDTVAYAPESAPALRRILLDVYGIDLFNPPPGTPKKAVVPRDYNRAVWQQYSPERWQEIRNVYGVTQVLVPSDWALALPSVAGQRGHFLLYEIP